MKNVLVTGGAGYVGSHAAKALHAAGFTPVVFDNLVYGHRQAVRFGSLIEGDLLDRAALDRVFRDFRPEAVLHFAAYAYVGESVTDPAKYYRNNVLGTLTLLEAMREHGVSHIAFSSTCATYGMPCALPIDESHPQQPINPYGQTKLIVERMLRDFHVGYGLRSVSLRYFNAAGADESGDTAELGEDHTPETHLIPLALDVAAGRRKAISVFGNDYDTPDGTCIRDYVHVSDLADAHIGALDFLKVNDGAFAFNLSTGRGYSVREVIACVERVTGRTVSIEWAARRAGDPAVLVGTGAAARHSIGWVPRYQNLDDIVRSAWRWHQTLERINGTASQP